MVRTCSGSNPGSTDSIETKLWTKRPAPTSSVTASANSVTTSRPWVSSQSCRTCGCALRTRFQRLVGLAPRNLPRRDQAEQNCGNKRSYQSGTQHMEVDPSVLQSRHASRPGVLRERRGRRERSARPTPQHAETRSRGPCFPYEQLPSQSAPARAQSGPHRYFSLACEAPRANTRLATLTHAINRTKNTAAPVSTERTNSVSPLTVIRSGNAFSLTRFGS